MMEEQFQWRKTEGGLCLGKYIGSASNVVIPDSYNGENVVEVGDYAFSAIEFLHEVVIGRNIVSVGRHAFYDSRNLARVEFGDQVRTMGDGAFKNCEKLHRIILHSSRGRDACIREILEECWQEVRVDLLYPDGEARLIFPEYDIEYFANYSTRPNLFYHEVYGSGEAYRSCLQEAALDYRTYDKLLERSGREDRAQVTAAIALKRLRWPRTLTTAAAETCRTWLLEHSDAAVTWCLEEEEEGGIQYLAEQKLLTPEKLPACLEAARQADNPAAVAILLTAGGAGSAGKLAGRKRYEL